MLYDYLYPYLVKEAARRYLENFYLNPYFRLYKTAQLPWLLLLGGAGLGGYLLYKGIGKALRATESWGKSFEKSLIQRRMQNLGRLYPKQQSRPTFPKYPSPMTAQNPYRY